MPLLDIATAQPSFQNNLYTIRSRIQYHGTFIFGSEKRLASSWTSILISEKAKNFNVGRIEMGRGGLMIKAVATLEPNCSIQSNDGHKDYHNIQLGTDSKSPLVIEHQSISEDSTELDEKEKLRRMRISQANKGNTPWNKGRKHSPETLQRIRERTRLAMQDPKVKMKLVNLGHAQSKETRIKIGVGVRIGWERRRGKLKLQETCHFEWQKLIAEASRRGFVGEEELQWDSYKILDEQLEQEWLESVEQRKNTPRPKGSKRAPKSLEQRRKISAAIAAKWTDPVYRDRVYSGLSKYHGTPVGVEKPKRRPTGDRQPIKRSPAKKIVDETDKGKVQNQRSRLKRSNKPMYKDPLASSKLEMIKSIRARRAAAENKKTEAITRAKLLIAEAEKAANALEVAATRSPLARASLIESRKLIAEAIKSIESIDTEQADSHENGWFTSRVELTGLVNHVEKETEEKIEDLSQADERKVNGNRGLASIENDITDFGFGKFRLQDLLDGKDEIDEMLPTSSYDHGKEDEEQLNGMGSSEYDLPELELERMIKQLGQQIEPNGSIIPNGAKSESTSPNNPLAITKKWVRGKLVEVAERDFRG